MNIDTFQENLELMSNSGYKLTHEQAALIENSLIILQSENKFRDIFFWGRIDGVDADYYLAFGCTKDLIKDRRFFYSLNCVNWFLLPNCDCSLMEAVKQNNEQFQGDPSYAKQVLMVSLWHSMITLNLSQISFLKVSNIRK